MLTRGFGEVFDASTGYDEYGNPFSVDPVSYYTAPGSDTLTIDPLKPYDLSIPGQPLYGSQNYSDILAGQAKTAATDLANANSLLKTLTSAGASAAQVAIAQSAVKSAQAAAQTAALRQVQQAAPGKSGCSMTLISGLCDSYVYMGGAAIGGVFLILLLKGRG